MAKPTITAGEEPVEYRLLEGARALLAAATGNGYIYDAAFASIVPQPHLKYLDEAGPDVWQKTRYLVSPGANNASDYTQCATGFNGDFLVTAAVPVGGPELPWTPGYVPVPKVQLRMVADIHRALHLKEIGDAVLKVEYRNLDIMVDGWAVVQVQMSFEYAEVDA